MSRRLVVKVCGVTTPDDAAMAAALGADALGLNFWPKSKRVVSVAQARRIVEAVPPFVWVVGLFIDPTLEQVRRVVGEVGLDAVQLHGDESPTFAARLGRIMTLKALRVADASIEAEAARYAKVDALVLDAPQAGYGGGGKTFDWKLARRVARRWPVLLAGGLTAENVGAAVAEVRPMGVDVASGVEKAPGIKDKRKVKAFIEAARAADKRED